ncbi:MULTISPECIES: SusC/RagA family TonB-linked outer membrane protein [unclassified Kaistella]|uniref:SusC/RagA family TonB-linked outer membrane protein n=1 Tax=unclassified Kaistella TaxID=2762626 RepID=UPI002733B494|nr:MULTISPECIES: SusC/RagA family TonB-linked outer membrane protein [unclassified Kaistella]MDP2454920.1 SusC/RagA family TonB-linked outer membrane protein [Kaistella sp. SH11-4b]MDP2456097.1 SusC/RagA family TonB-linked outer membrane protein [Kaistella sp. SH40-3]MDP2460590.1 SusC/RagA family TonB-linked outer membrane protein [Kaistella sp. SH19-2b]
MNVKLRVLTAGVLFFTGQAVMAQKDTLKTQNIDEVVLVGYGVQKKTDVTGAIATVKSSVLQEQPVSSVELALQGKASGVQVASTGGRSGNSTKISIRGNGSLSASNSPLYIIDGVPQESLGNLSSEDIVSMQILKDAASSAIYGSRASNGVVLVETKSGKYNSKPTVTFNSSYGIQEIIKRPDLLNGDQYKQVHDAARQNYMNDIAKGVLTAPAAGTPGDQAIKNPMVGNGINTNWMDYVLRTGAVTNNQIGFTAGNENSKVYLSLAHVTQEGIINKDEFQVSRVRLNIEQKMSDKFKIGINSYYSQSNSVPIADDNNTYQPYSNAIKAAPNKVAYAADGSVNRAMSSNNPLHSFEREETDKWQRIGANFFAIYNPIKDITLKTSISGNLGLNRFNQFDAPNTRRGELNGKPYGYGYYSTKNNRDYLIENTATYDKKFADGKLSVNIIAGQSFQNWQYEDSFVKGENFPSNDLKWLVSAATINDGRSYMNEMSLASFFGRAQFSWDNKYNLMLSTRYDGSSKFTEDNRWGNFPAASIGWTASNESFFNVPVINELKFRASYGFTGNQTGIPFSAGLNLISAGQNHNQNPGLAVTDLFDPTRKWEKGESMDVGMDLSMFNKRVNLTVDLYDKTTNDLLYRLPVNQETGFLNMLTNIGSINNKGIEVSLDTKIIKSDKLNWDFGANFSYNKNVVETIGTKTGQFTTGFASIVKEGESLGSFYLIEALGVAKERYEYKDKNGKVTKVVQAGDMIYNDINGDGKIDSNDKKVFGGGIAPMYGGLSTRISYGMVDLSANAQYSIGKKIYAMYKEKQVGGAAIGAPSFSENMIGEQMNYWTPDNMNTNVPRPHHASAISAWNNERSSRFLEDADYLRITDITLGVNFSKEQLGFIKSMRVYAQVRNPFTFTKYSGVDPETYYVDQTINPNQSTADTTKISSGVDSNGIPNVKVYSLGMNINF